MGLRKTLDPTDLVAIVDTREQMPLDLSPMRAERGTLSTADYSLKGLENIIAVERKSLEDLIGCVGNGRERFERELARLRAYPCRAVVVEATWAELQAGGWRSKVTPASAVGSVLAWISEGIPFLFVGTHEAAGRAVARLMYVAAKREWRKLLALQGAVSTESES